MKTINDILKKNSPATFNDVVLLIAYCCNKTKEFVLTHREYRLSLGEYAKLAFLLFLLKRGYPIAYLTHQREFYGLNFKVNKYTLIPRPETELIVEEVVKTITALPEKNSGIVLIDIGTGSGCIPVAIAHSLKKNRTPVYPKEIIATDISGGALRIAKKNAVNHATPITFLKGSLLKPIIGRPHFPFSDSIIFITANLPYLTKEQAASEPFIQKEPRSALTAENGGLALYDRLLAQIGGAWRNNELYIFLEIDPSQSEKIKRLVQKHLPTTSILIKPDLARRDRVVVVRHLSI